MQEFIFDAIAMGGYWGIALLMAVENVFPPIPSEVIMGIGGVLVARGEMEFWPLILVGTIGSTAGNYVWYWVGDRIGYRRLKHWIKEHGRWLVMSCDDLDKAVRFFQSHGQWVVFALRFSPFLRTMVSLPAFPFTSAVKLMLAVSRTIVSAPLVPLIVTFVTPVNSFMLEYSIHLLTSP